MILSPAAVRKAYLFLADELFFDVAVADRTHGMAALVACLLTGMSHPVLPEKPVFRITGATARQRQDHGREHDCAADHSPIGSWKKVVGE